MTGWCDSITYEIEANTRASQKNERNSRILDARQTEEGEQLFQDSKELEGHDEADDYANAMTIIEGEDASTLSYVYLLP